MRESSLLVPFGIEPIHLTMSCCGEEDVWDGIDNGGEGFET